MNHAVRKRHPSPEESLVASVVDLGAVPRCFYAAVSSLLSLFYRRAASELPLGADPEDYVLILPDWDGSASGKYGAQNVYHDALVVVDEDDYVKACHQCENLAEATIEMLE